MTWIKLRSRNYEVHEHRRFGVRSEGLINKSMRAKVHALKCSESHDNNREILHRISRLIRWLYVNETSFVKVRV
ncbi:MAG: hypothetical protein QXM73_03810 [Candidatus Nezhaarchaeales archaeon]